MENREGAICGDEKGVAFFCRIGFLRAGDFSVSTKKGDRDERRIGWMFGFAFGRIAAFQAEVFGFREEGVVGRRPRQVAPVEGWMGGTPECDDF